MKNIVLILIALLPVTSFAQTFKKDDLGKSTNPNFPAYLLDTVVKSDYTKQQLFSNALRYVSANFEDSRNVIESKDADLGELSLKCYKEVNNTNLYFKCRIYVKDNVFKVVLSSLETNHVVSQPHIRTSVVANYTKSEPNNRAIAFAMNVIRDIALQINRKPENVF